MGSVWPGGQVDMWGKLHRLAFDADLRLYKILPTWLELDIAVNRSGAMLGRLLNKILPQGYIHLFLRGDSLCGTGTFRNLTTNEKLITCPKCQKKADDLCIQHVAPGALAELLLSWNKAALIMHDEFEAPRGLI